MVPAASQAPLSLPQTLYRCRSLRHLRDPCRCQAGAFCVFQSRCTTCDFALADLPNPCPCTTGYSPGSLAVDNLVSDSECLAASTCVLAVCCVTWRLCPHFPAGPVSLIRSHSAVFQPITFSSPFCLGGAGSAFHLHSGIRIGPLLTNQVPK